MTEITADIIRKAWATNRPAIQPILRAGHDYVRVQIPSPIELHPVDDAVIPTDAEHRCVEFRLGVQELGRPWNHRVVYAKTTSGERVEVATIRL